MLPDAARPLLPGAWWVPLRHVADARGSFTKTHAASALAALGVSFTLAEAFHSVSRRDVVRGMHFQVPPHDHDKIVQCLHGSAIDVLLDLRPGPGYGRTVSVPLRAGEPAVVVVPRGVAHGFRSLEDGTVMAYLVSTEHSPAHDAGIRWDRIGGDWGDLGPAGADGVVLSDRDRAHPAFSDVVTPFPPLA